MLPYFHEHYGNAASRHHEYGWTAEGAVEHARSQVAALIGARPDEIIFTSGATESINLALKGAAEGNASRGDHIIAVQTEHKAVLDTCSALERRGFAVTYLPVDKHGLVSVEDVRKAITGRTILVTAMMANNEIGTIAPIAEIGAVCRAIGVLFHSDCAQSVGKVAVDVLRLNVDLLSFSAHKMYGPKGVGALFVRKANPPLRLAHQIDGGGHEHGMRSGTLNVPGIAGFGKAAEVARSEMADDSRRTSMLRDKLVQGIVSQLDGVSLNGHPVQRLPNNANITITNVRADRLMMDMKDIAVSSGSACSSALQRPSHVLKAIGMQKAGIASTIRFGLGRFTTADEIEYTIRRVVETVNNLRAASRGRKLETSKAEY
jgi:cysteine desulfurase